MVSYYSRMNLEHRDSSSAPIYIYHGVDAAPNGLPRLARHKSRGPFRAQAIKKAKKVVKRKQTLKFTVDCSQPVDDGIMDAASFVSCRPWLAQRGSRDRLADNMRGPCLGPPPTAPRLSRFAGEVSPGPH